MSKLILQEPQNIQSYCNLQGMVRLNRVKSALKDNRIETNELIEIFNKWRNQKEYFVLWERGKSKGKAYLCSKRGNDVYNYQINQKFKEIERLAHFYGDSKLFDINQSNPKTNCLFLTLTYDTKLSSLDEAWKQIGIQYNRFVSGIKRKFGNCAIIRAFESFQNGYPHIHAIMLFDEKEFDVFEHWNKRGTKSSFRIKQKPMFEMHWHSHVDITAVHTIKGALGYLTKYLKKAYNKDSKYELTLAMLWIYHKQAFAISGKFLEKLKQIRLDTRSLSNSNKLTQLDLEGDPIHPDLVFVGVFSYVEISKLNKIENPDSWVHVLSMIPEHNILNNEDKKIARYLYSANLGTSIEFSPEKCPSLMMGHYEEEIKLKTLYKNDKNDTKCLSLFCNRFSFFLRLETPTNPPYNQSLYVKNITGGGYSISS